MASENKIYEREGTKGAGKSFEIFQSRARLSQEGKNGTLNLGGRSKGREKFSRHEKGERVRSGMAEAL